MAVKKNEEARWQQRKSGKLLTIDLRAKVAPAHSLFSFSAFKIRPKITGDKLKFRITGSYRDAADAKARPTPFLFIANFYRKGEFIREARAKVFFDSLSKTVAFSLDVEPGETYIQLVLYCSAHLRGVLNLKDIKLVSGLREIDFDTLETRRISLKKRWEQKGRRVYCHSYFGSHWMEVPSGWRLDQVHPAVLKMVEHTLYAILEESYFELERQPVPNIRSTRKPGPNTILSFSLGTDSTAALTLLPPDTISYYCQRNQEFYYNNLGQYCDWPSQKILTQRLKKIPHTIILRNNFELACVSAGLRHGFANGYGYAALGMLIADHYDAGNLAFGSVMEQVFLRSGNIYTDIVKCRPATYLNMKNLLAKAGLHMNLPTGGCSEVLTSRIAAKGRFAALALSCPAYGPRGEPCGVCFKCFRKERLDGVPNPEPVSSSVLSLLHKRPLKSATSVVRACQISGLTDVDIDEYLGENLDFLDHYYEYGVEQLNAPHLASHIRQVMAELDISPMSREQTLRMRLISQVFSPNEFSYLRAGFALPKVMGRTRVEREGRSPYVDPEKLVDLTMDQVILPNRDMTKFKTVPLKKFNPTDPAYLHFLNSR